MMGRSHSIVGVASWLALAPVLARWAGQPVGLRPLGCGVAVAAGAALLPDIDHPSASIAHTFGPVSEAMATAVEKLTGGHRHATHTLLATVGVTASMWALGRYDRYTAVAVTLLLVSFAVHLGRHGGRRLGAILFGCGLAALLLRWSPPGAVDTVSRWTGGLLPVGNRQLDWLVRWVPAGLWLPASVGVGYVSHLVIDSFNKQPVPWLAPFKGSVRLDLIRVNTAPEHICAAVIGACALWLAWSDFGPAVTVWLQRGRIV